MPAIQSVTSKLPPISNTWRKISRDAYKELAEELPKGSFKKMLIDGEENPSTYRLLFRKNINGETFYKGFFNKNKAEYLDKMGNVYKDTDIFISADTKYAFEHFYNQNQATRMPKFKITNNPDGTKTYLFINSENGNDKKVYTFLNGETYHEGDTFTTRKK